MFLKKEPWNRCCEDVCKIEADRVVQGGWITLCEFDYITSLWYYHSTELDH